MKVITLNGQKLASAAFALLCCTVIMYVGFINPHTVAVTATVQPTVPIALVVEGFGTGQNGTREFLYMDIAFSGIVDNTAPLAQEDKELLISGGREVFLNYSELGFAPIRIDGMQSVAAIEQNLRDAIEMAEKTGYAVVIAQLGEGGGIYTAKAIANVISDTSNINFVTISRLKEVIS